MAGTYILSPGGLERLFAAMAGEGRRILAPVHSDGRTDLKAVQHLSEVSLDALQTTLGAKETVFPKVERILSYSTESGKVELRDAEPQPLPTVLFGARPCEATAFGPLDAVFNWDTRDRFFNARMAHLTVVGLGCTQADEACFCTSVGGGPTSTQGSDLFLMPFEGGYLAEVLSEKGEALLALAPDAFQPANGADRSIHAAHVAPAFDAKVLTAKLPGMFDSDEWVDQSLRCVGCGACAYVCPTCVCFDLQEEADPRKGQRLRCWDSCGLRMFTLHASGHNPREVQSARWRQRIYHKFSYYPDRYRMLGCVGCGKCTRACPVDMNLREHLIHASEVSA